MIGWLRELSLWVEPVFWHSLQAIPALAALMVLQRFARRWITPRGLIVLWLIALGGLLVPFRLLVPAPFWPLPSEMIFSRLSAVAQMNAHWGPAVPAHAGSLSLSWSIILTVVWLCGVMLMSVRLLIPILRHHRHIGGLRACTDSSLLGLLEDVRAEEGVRIPISLVVHDSIPAPALYGFLRPRILMPSGLTGRLSDQALRFIFRHEVVHVRYGDIALNWVTEFALVVHWFNPLVWWIPRHVARAREMACDRAVLRRAETPRDYGTVLLQVAEISTCSRFMAGATGIVENKNAMKERIEMLTQSYQRLSGVWMLAAALALSLFLFSGPLQATDDNDSATTASQQAAESWLPLIDTRRYAESYDGFCVAAKIALTKDKWVATNVQVHGPLGDFVSRSLQSKQFLAVSPEGVPGPFVILQYNTEFQNFKATETVTTMQDKDGQWRIAGYFIRPRN